MQTHTRNPTTWLMLLVTLLACLAVQSLGQKTASGQIYALQSASWGVTPWEAAPRLGLRASADESVSAPPVGANGGSVADEAAALNRIGENANGPVLNGKAPNTVLNQQAVNDLGNGSLPGITKNPNTGLPDAVPRTGVPREMPGSPNPSATAEDFANRLFGGTSTPANAKPIPNCNGCWNATNADGVSVTYRPASTASVDTAATTASVDINFKPNGNVINGGKPVKLKFPQQGGK